MESGKVCRERNDNNNEMKAKYIIVLLAGLACAGCNTINYTQTTVDPSSGSTNNVTMKVSRVFWSTENYEAVMNPTGGGTLKASKSNVDSAAILAVGQVAIEAMSSGAKAAAK